MGNNLFLPFDIFCRHKTVAKLIGNQKGEILDVGGGVKGLNRFVKNKVVVTNLAEGEVLADGRALPFADNSFAVVTCMDVLEHIPPQDRGKFINQLKRVAQKMVVLSFPIGTKEHFEAEKKGTFVITKTEALVNTTYYHFQNMKNIDFIKVEKEECYHKTFNGRKVWIISEIYN